MTYKIIAENYADEGRLWRYDVVAGDGGNMMARTFYFPRENGEKTPSSYRMKQLGSTFLHELSTRTETGYDLFDGYDDTDIVDGYRATIREVAGYLRNVGNAFNDNDYKAWYTKKFPASVFDYNKILKLVKDRVDIRKTEVNI